MFHFMERFQWYETKFSRSISHLIAYSIFSENYHGNLSEDEKIEKRVC